MAEDKGDFHKGVLQITLWWVVEAIPLNSYNAKSVVAIIIGKETGRLALSCVHHRNLSCLF